MRLLIFLLGQLRYRYVIDLHLFGNNAWSGSATELFSPEEQTDLPSIALSVRMAMIKAHDPEFQRAKIADAQAYLLAWTNASLSPRVTLPSSRALINCAPK